jgi:hypothetical protein
VGLSAIRLRGTERLPVRLLPKALSAGGVGLLLVAGGITGLGSAAAKGASTSTAPAASRCDDAWTGGAGTTAWSSATNWSAGVPDHADVRACILGDATVVVPDASFSVGTLAVSAGSTLDIGAGGSGGVTAATLAVSSGLVNDGTVVVAPGGLIHLGRAATLTNEPDGLLVFGIDGAPASATGYGRITNGTLSLGGSADPVFADGYAPAPGEEYFVYRGTSTGAFATVLNGATADYSHPDEVGLTVGAPAPASADGTSTSTAVTQGVNPATATTTTTPSSPSTDQQAIHTTVPTTTSLTSSSPASTYGQGVSFTATVTPTSGSISPTGTVTFSDEGTPLGSASLSPTGGVATATFASSSIMAGTQWVTATYSGDPNSSVSSSAAPVRLRVAEAMTSVTVASSATGAGAGQDVTFTATINSAATGETGTVQFDDNGSILGTGAVSGGHATFQTSSLAPGSHPITAVYEGDDDFVGTSSTNTVGQAIPTAPRSQIATTTSLTSSSPTSTYGQGVSFTATVTPTGGSISPAGTVTFYDEGTPLGSASLSPTGGVATAIFASSSMMAGTHWITATYSGDPNSSVGSSGAPLRLAVAETMTSVTVASSAPRAGAGQDVTLTATIDSGVKGETGTVQFDDNGILVGSASVLGGRATLQTSSLTPGTITAVYEGDDDFVGTSSTNTIGEAIFTSTLGGVAVS